MGHRTEFAAAGKVNYLFSRRAGQGKAASVGVGYTKLLKRQSAKVHRRLGRFLVTEALEHDLEGDDTTPVQFTFTSPCYYCPECGARFEDRRDMEECADAHSNDACAEFVGRNEDYLGEMREWAASMGW